MRNCFAILLAGIFTLQGTMVHLEDFLSINNLLRHYSFHQNEYGDSLSRFISKHYGELKEQHNKKHREERKDHHNLPFQHHVNYITSIDYSLNTFDDFLKVPIEIPLQENNNFYYQRLYTSLTKGCLFRPPQFA